MARFNPTMVRLLPDFTVADAVGFISVSIPQWCDCCPAILFQHLSHLRFQSHNGAIAAAERCYGNSGQHGFNPTMVRLLLAVARDLGIKPTVSIPQWCDCCATSGTGLYTFTICFNPTMVRLLHMLRREGKFRQMAVSIPQWCDCCNNRATTP